MKIMTIIIMIIQCDTNIDFIMTLFVDEYNQDGAACAEITLPLEVVSRGRYP